MVAGLASRVLRGQLAILARTWPTTSAMISGSGSPCACPRAAERRALSWGASRYCSTSATVSVIQGFIMVLSVAGANMGEWMGEV